jgi:hypothetical protein
MKYECGTMKYERGKMNESRRQETGVGSQEKDRPVFYTDSRLLSPVFRSSVSCLPFIVPRSSFIFFLSTTHEFDQGAHARAGRSGGRVRLGFFVP